MLVFFFKRTSEHENSIRECQIRLSMGLPIGKTYKRDTFAPIIGLSYWRKLYTKIVAVLHHHQAAVRRRTFFFGRVENDWSVELGISLSRKFIFTLGERCKKQQPPKGFLPLPQIGCNHSEPQMPPRQGTNKRR